MARKKTAKKVEETGEFDRFLHEGHHYLIIIFLIAVIVSLVFLIPPAIVPLGEEESQVPIPTVPKKIPELVRDYEPEFIRASFEVNQEHDFGLFETKLLRIGFYTFYNNMSRQEETAFRADIWARNAGKANEDFRAFNGFIRQPPYQYNVSGGAFNGDNVAPGEVRDGYILFENVPTDLKGDISLSIGTALSYNTIFGIQSQFPFLYEFSYPGK